MTLLPKEFHTIEDKREALNGYNDSKEYGVIDGTIQNQLWFKGKGLGDKISLGTSYMHLGKEVAQQFGGLGKRIRVGVGQLKGNSVILFAPSEHSGYSITQSGVQIDHSYKMGSKALIRWLRSHGVDKKYYKVRKIKNGFIGEPVEE